MQWFHVFKSCTKVSGIHKYVGPIDVLRCDCSAIKLVINLWMVVNRSVIIQIWGVTNLLNCYHIIQAVDTSMQIYINKLNFTVKFILNSFRFLLRFSDINVLILRIYFVSMKCAHNYCCRLLIVVAGLYFDVTAFETVILQRWYWMDLKNWRTAITGSQASSEAGGLAGRERDNNNNKMNTNTKREKKMKKKWIVHKNFIQKHW